MAIFKKLGSSHLFQSHHFGSLQVIHQKSLKCPELRWFPSIELWLGSYDLMILLRPKPIALHVNGQVQHTLETTSFDWMICFLMEWWWCDWMNFVYSLHRDDGIMTSWVDVLMIWWHYDMMIRWYDDMKTSWYTMIGLIFLRWLIWLTWYSDFFPWFFFQIPLLCCLKVPWRW